MQPFYPTHPSPIIAPEIVTGEFKRIKAKVEFWKSIMDQEIASWSNLTDFRPARDRLMFELNLGGFAYPWPGTIYYNHGKPVVGPGLSYPMKTLFPIKPVDNYSGPMGIPWSIIVNYETRIFKNHKENLIMVAAHGGLHPSAMLAILQDRDYFEMDEHLAGQELQKIINQFNHERV